MTPTEAAQRRRELGIVNSAGRVWGGCRSRGRIPIPKHAHPLVRGLVEAMNDQQTTFKEVYERAGLGHTTMGKWCHSSMPRIDQLDAALNVLGLRLMIGPKDGRR